MKEQQYHYNRLRKNSPRRLAIKILAILLGVCGLGLIGSYMREEMLRPPESVIQPPLILREQPAGVIPKPEPEPLPETFYPIGQLFKTQERQTYSDGDMMLYIPRLGLKTPILDGVDEETLKRGVGLFDQSQLPGSIERNANVSVAGHRDIYGMEFYYIDTITNNDKIFLTWRGDLYTYEYETTYTTNPKDWDPIRVKPYASITMQSCTPIGVASNRIFVIGRLVSVTPGETFPTEEELAAQSQAAENGMESSSDKISFPVLNDSP